MGVVDEEDVGNVFKEHFEYSTPDDILRECEIATFSRLDIP